MLNDQIVNPFTPHLIYTRTIRRIFLQGEERDLESEQCSANWENFVLQGRWHP